MPVHICALLHNGGFAVPDNMIINGVECSDKQAIVEHFNSFFASVGELNSKNITEHGDSPISTVNKSHDINKFLY